MAESLEFKRGDTWPIPFTYTDDTGAPLDLSGCSARLQVRDRRTQEVYLEGTEGTGEVVITALTGEVDVRFLPEATALVSPGTHEADLEMTYADGTVESTETFSIKVIADVTRDAS